MPFSAKAIPGIIIQVLSVVFCAVVVILCRSCGIIDNTDYLLVTGSVVVISIVDFVGLGGDIIVI